MKLKVVACVLLVLGLTTLTASALPICDHKTQDLYINEIDKYLDYICIVKDNPSHPIPMCSPFMRHLIRLELHSDAESICKCLDDLKHHKWLSVDCGLLAMSLIPESEPELEGGKILGRVLGRATKAIEEIEILDEMGGETIKNFRRWTTYPAVKIDTIIDKEKGKIYDLYLVYNMKRNGLIDEEVWIKEYPWEFGPASEVKIMKLKIKGRKGVVTYWDHPIGEWK